VPTLVPTISETALYEAVITSLVLDASVEEFAPVAQAVVPPTLASFYRVPVERFHIISMQAASVSIDVLILSSDEGLSAAALADSIVADIATGQLTFSWTRSAVAGAIASSPIVNAVPAMPSTGESSEPSPAADVALAAYFLQARCHRPSLKNAFPACFTCRRMNSTALQHAMKKS
jgi:hypothetical protein